MSEVLQVIAVERPFVRYLITGDDIFSDQTSGRWSLTNKKVVRTGLLKIPRKL